MASIVTPLCRLFRALLIPLALLLTIAAVSTLTLREAERRRISEVESPPPGWLPVVAFTPGGAELLRYSELDEYREAHPEFTFLAPEGQEEVLNRKLAASYRKKFPTGKAAPAYKAERIAPGRQSVEVGLFGDRDTIVWYEATDKEIYPRRYLQRGIFFGLFPLVWSLVISGVVGGLGYSLWRMYREVARA